MDEPPDDPELPSEYMDEPPDDPELSYEDMDEPPEDDPSEPSLGGALPCPIAPSLDAIIGAADAAGGGTDATSFFFPPQP